MKPSLSAIALAALLATASAKEGYHAYVETEAKTDAYILDTVPYTPLSEELYDEYSYYPHTQWDAGPNAYCFTSQTTTGDFSFQATSIFNGNASYLKLFSTRLTATEGSIILDGVQLSASDLSTKMDGSFSEDWGLPQIALNNVSCVKGDYSVLESNYCTLNNWKADDYTLKLTAGGGSFTSGTVNGTVTIDALETVKFDNLTVNKGASLSVTSLDSVYLATMPGRSSLGNGILIINAQNKAIIGETPGVGEEIHVLQGNLTVNYTGKGSEEGWDVDVLSQVNGSLTVNAATGRVNAGILSGSGKITAKLAYLTSFTGSNLEIHATDAVTVNGNVEATAAAASGDYAVVLEGAGISIGGSVSATSGGVSLKSTGTDISIEGAWSTAKPSSLVSARDIIIRGEVSGSMAATAANSIFLYADAALAQSTLDARVYHGGKLVLKEHSSVTGDVISSVSGAGVVVENSSISGLVDGAGTLELCNGVIGSAQNISTLKSQGVSSITAQAGPLTLDALVLGGGRLTLGTPESHSAAVVLNKLTVDASTILNANLKANDGATLEFSENSVVTLGCTVTLMGDVGFIVSGEGLLMDSVEDVLDANGQSITLSWDHSADLPVWHKELYEAADARGNTFYTTNAAAPGATLSMLQLVYDRTMQDNGCLRITAIPEPATATLSLLALAALCARRRGRA